MTKPVIWSNFGNIVRDFTWRPWHPHKVLRHSGEPLAMRIARLRRMYDASRYHDADFLTRVLDHLLADCHPAIHRLARDLAIENDLLFDFPEFPNRSLTGDEVGMLETVLDDLELRLANEDAIRHHFLYGIKRVADACADLLSPNDASSMTVPLISPDRVADTMSFFTADLMGDRITSRAFLSTADALFENVLAISHLTFEQFEKAPHKVIRPHQYDGDPADYVRGTALERFFETQLPFVIPRHLWREHAAMFAPSGHGKTQALQAIILDFLAGDTPALFILDSHGDMLRKVRALDPPGLIVIDPEATEPPALNFLDFKGNSADVVELFSYLMSALSAELSSTQSTMAAFILRLMRAIPGATIDTLRQVMEDPAKVAEKSRFAAAIDTLDPIAQDYFRNQFYASGSIAATKSSVARRIYKLLANPTFARMFSASTNSFDAFAAMQEKRIVLINTSMRLLRAEASSVFGRYMLAQILAAAYQRVRVPERDRHLALVIVDEAAPYMDDTVERILTETRKFGVGLLLASQFLEQIPSGVKAAINGNTSIKLAGPVGYSDANALGREMYTTGEFLRSMRKSDTHTELACYVRNVTPAAVRLNVPLGLLEDIVGHPQLEHHESEDGDGDRHDPAPRARDQHLNELSLRDTTLPLPNTAVPASPPAAPSQPPAPTSAVDPSKPSEW